MIQLFEVDGLQFTVRGPGFKVSDFGRRFLKVYQNRQS